jgi:hypothetical protein
MSNFNQIANADQLHKIFESTQDKLIVLMFYTKNNPECRKAKSGFDKSAANHMTSIFCFIDVDKFEGESRFVQLNNNMPKFDFYFAGNSIASFSSSNDRDIENGVRSCEQYVMTQNNMKNSGQMNPGQMNNGTGLMATMQQINPVAIQQQILNNAMMQNPQLAQQLIQNPAMLQQLVQRQIQQIQQQNQYQQMLQQQQMNSQLNQVNQVNQVNPLLMNNANLQAQASIAQLANAINSPSTGTNVLPTIQQMQQMFQIFQMMQQMGILNVPQQLSAATTSTTTTPQTVPETKPTDPDNTIVLDNGDKLIPLPNGKYGLVKKIDH